MRILKFLGCDRSADVHSAVVITMDKAHKSKNLLRRGLVEEDELGGSFLQFI
jgi:hypothetical protein